MQKLLLSHFTKVLLFAAMLVGLNSWGQIASDGLNGSGTLLTVAGGAFYNTSTTTSDRPSSVAQYSEGTAAYGVSNATATLTSGNINTSAYAGIEMSFRLAAFSIGSTTNGLDSNDFVTVEVSPDGGTNWWSTVRVGGGSGPNSYWGFASGTGIASTAYDGNATPVDFAPTTTGAQTTNGYSTVKVTGLPAVSSLRVRITLLNNATSERWVVDDFKVTGTVSSAPILAITGTSGHGSTCPTVAATPITYTITNSGTVAASGVSVVSSGTNNADFVVTGLSSTTIAANGGTATFTGTFSPATSGSKTATFTASSTTTNAVSGTINLTGTGTTPVAADFQVLAAQDKTASSATIKSYVYKFGVCPTTIEKGFVFAKASDNNNPAVGGTGVTKTAVAGVTTIGDFSLPVSSLTAETTYNYKSYFYDGTTYTYSNLSTFTTTGTPPALTAAVGATVDAPFVITFTENAAWRNGITSITIDGTTLAAGAYDKTVAGQITFTPSASSPAALLQTAATRSIIINSTNYTATPALSQAIGAGAAARLALTTQPTAPSVNGGTLTAQPVVVVRDQYGNPTTSTASITATATAATWTLGGTVTISATAGTATFSGLTASTPTSLTGATIQFTSPGLTSVTSNTFSIPPVNDLCGNATALTVNAAAIAGTNVGATYTTITGVTSKKDVWYTFVAACTGPYTINVTGTTKDIDMGLYADACPTNSTTVGTAVTVNSSSETLNAASLTSGTTYYIRVYTATTADETAFNIQVVNSFAPTVSAGASATGVSQQGATITGSASVAACSGAITAYGVEISQTLNFTPGSGVQYPGNNISGGNFSVTMSSLAINTTYYYRTYATNTAGTTYSSPQGTFTTTTVPVTLPYNQNFETATTDFAFGAAGTNKWVIGTATQNGGTKSLYISSNGSTYAYTTGSAADTYADIYVDLTSATAATLTFDWKSGGEGTVGGSIYDYGEVYINTGGADILISSTKEFFGSSSAFQNKEILLTPYVGGIRKLRFRWVNDTSTGSGIPLAIDNIVIVASARPVLTTAAISNLTYNAATSGGTITNDGGSAIIARGVVYATTASPTLANTVVSAGTGSGTFVANMTGLIDNKTYYVRAYATNGTTTAYGNEVTFTTNSVNAPVATAATYDGTAGTTGFIANWNASTAATEYFLDVATTTAFGAVVISEDFSGCNGNGTSTNIAGSLNNYLQNAGWTGTSVWEGPGNVKLSASSTAGVITTPTIDLSGNGGTATLTFDVSQFGTDNTSIQVLHAPNGTTFTQVGSNISVGTGGSKTVAITGGTASSKIRIQTTNSNRFYLDNFKIAYSTFVTGYDNLSVGNTTSKNVTGLTAGTTYYYRVRAKGPNSTSANSNVITAIAKLSNVWNGTVWTAGTPPTSNHNAIIQGNYNTSANGTFNANQLVLNSGIFTIASGTNLTVQNEVVNNAGAANFVIENNGNLLQVNDVDNTGAITVAKNSAPLFRLDYAMWSSPVGGETLAGLSPQTLSNRFYRYNPLSDEYATMPGTTTFAEGAGYLIRVANTHPAFVNAQTPGTPWQGTFTGTPNNGDVDVAVTPQQSGVSQGYNAVGNPYPSPINIFAFYAANTGTIADGSALYFWRKKNDASTSYYARVTKLAYTANTGNAWGDAGGNAFNGAPNTWVINPGQGFIVQATGSTVHFNNGMRTAVNNGQIFRTAQDESQIAVSRLWLNLSGQDSFSQAAIGYTDMTTLSLDYGWDGKAFVNDGDLTLFSLAGEETLGIQARPSFDASDVVPMGYQATTAGSYTIALDHMDGVFEAGQDIYLQDNLLNITHDLKQGGYAFTTEAGITTGRFNILYAQPLSTDNPVLDSNSVIVYKEGNSININSGTVDMTGVSVYDTRGRLLYSGKDINATTTVINGLQAEKQVLIINIATTKGDVSKKIIF
ncbi:T9SS sorting signal type C domain-containing protein [Flavobacterium sp. DGU11]|uniref:T9SS sorting signal type C domain-containing protein n=1 Tax=Flavobacterium arundinis TaxID=3139143 RepID=A0ABU9HW61_9FLAO